MDKACCHVPATPAESSIYVLYLLKSINQVVTTFVLTTKTEIYLNFD